jgi:hypothetical protein
MPVVCPGRWHFINAHRVAKRLTPEMPADLTGS